MDHNNILAVVLAGGKSKRFGRDKSQIKLGDKILIDYILTEIIDLYKDILIVTNEPIKFLDSDKISLTSDIIKDLGPLGGVFSAMKWVKENRGDYKWISTFPIDTPFFKKEHLNKFYKEINLDKSNLFFMKSKNTRHNIFGLWSLELYKKFNLYPVLRYLIYLVNLMRENNIVWGVGRGSSVSSYVLFLIGVHKVNSIEFDLDINEFLR